MIKQQALRHTTPFVGRAKEVASIAERLLSLDCRLLTLTGLGGSGKTRLAIEATSRIASQFAHGVVFVALQPLPRGDLLLSAITQALGLTLYGEDEPQEQLFAYLHDKDLLLVLDNFEHLLDQAAFVSALLAAAPGLTVLATSREALRLQEEWLCPLHGLAAPLSVYATSLEEYEAVQLFLSHARRIQPSFDLTSEREAIIRICMMTAGLPLALELAASWLKGLHAADIVQAMQRNLDLLFATTRNMEPRHRSMRAVFDQSWALLAEDERRMFARLSVFRGGFTSDAAERVAGASLAELAALVEKSLIHLDSGRFGMHELLRQYAVERLEAIGEEEATHARHSHYFAELMRGHEAALKQSQQREAAQAIEHDFENIRLAWEWSTKYGRAADLHALLDGLYLFGFLHSRYREIVTIFQHTLEQPVAEQLLHGRLLARRWGYLHWWSQADYTQALTDIEQAQAIALGEGDQFEVAFCHLMAAYALMNMQRYAKALPHLETSLALFEALGEPYYVCWVLHRLGYVFYNLNESGKGNQYTEQSLILARSTHNRIAVVICVYNLGCDYFLSGDYVRARQYCAEAFHVTSEAGHQGQSACALSMLALCAFFQGDYTICQEYAERSWTIIEDISMFICQAYNLAALIVLACLREDYVEAVRLKELEQQYNTNTMGFQLLHWTLAVVSCGVGQAAEACMSIQEVLERSNLQAHSAVSMWLAPCVAYTLAASDPAKAVEVLAWVFSYPHPGLNWARQWPLVSRLQTQLQATIDPQIYQAHWERGKALTPEQLASYFRQEFRAPADMQVAAAENGLLTAREREILGLIATGKTNPQIAAQLIIGTGTVKTHTLSIYRKLEVANRTHAIVRAQELGLIPV